MQHQDWETFIVHCKNEPKTNNKKQSKEIKKKTGGISKAVKIEKLVEEDQLKHKVIPKEIADLIRNKRCEMKLKQKDLAQQLNVNVSVINDVETGKALYNGLLISKIKRKLNIR
jgi:putative transcription factor